MVLKLRLIGSGQRGDNYRVNLPTYSLLHGNIDRQEAIVSIPDDVHGLAPKDLEHEKVEHTTEGDYYPSLCGECVGAIHEHLDDRYVEHKGEFRLELV